MISEENPIQQPITHRSPAHTHNQPALAERTANTTMDSTITKPCYQCGKMTHTDKTLADQCRLMTAIANTSMNSATTKVCYQCDEVTHADKMLADQCRLMIAILGECWGRLISKPMDMSKVARKPMAKHDGNDDPDEDTSAEMTESTGEINSKEVWTASRPTNPNRSTAATELKLNSNSTRGPTQELLHDKTSTKSWHKTNIDLAQDKDQTEIDKPDHDKEATGTDTVQKDVNSGEPDHDSPEADERAFTTTIGEVDKPSDEPLTITSEFKKPPTRPHIFDVGDDDTSEEEETDEPDYEPLTITSEFKKPPTRPHIIDVGDADTSEE
jgi:hypothetical protein